MKMNTYEQKQILEGLMTERKVYKLKPYEATLKLNKKIFRNKKIERLKNELSSTLKTLKNAIDLYKELKNKTEYWERKETYNFNKEDWYKLRKVNGKITRYYNEICEIEKNVQIEEEEKWQQQKIN